MSTTHLAHYAPVTVRCVTATDPDTGEVGIALDYANGVTLRVRMPRDQLISLMAIPDTAPPPLTVVIRGPQGCGKTFHAKKFAEAYGCTRVIDEGQFDSREQIAAARKDLQGALLISQDDEIPPGVDLVVEARTRAGFDKAVSLLPQPSSKPPGA